MALFGKRRQQGRDNVQKEEPKNMEKAIATISARLRFLEVLTSHLVAELPPKKRDALLEQVREVVDGLMVLPPPIYVSPPREQDFHDELRTAMRLLLEETANLKPRPINR